MLLINSTPMDMWMFCTLGLCIVAVLILNIRQKRKVAELLGFRSRCISAVNETVTKLPSEKAASNLTTSAANYASVFPPSQRAALQNLAQALPSQQREASGNIKVSDGPDEQNLLGWEEDYRTALPSKHTCTGVSIQEVMALGDFPDYAALTGVPLPSPYSEFDIEKGRPRPYRPLRWVYHQNMSLMKLDVDWWIELESTYRERMKQRKELYKMHGKTVMHWLPGSELACKETMELAIQFVCARYPQYFTLSEDRQTLTNKILNIQTTIAELHPLEVLLEHIPEDFVVMSRDPETGYYHFRAGLICSAIGWNTGTKIGKQLHEIHAPIPDYKEKMQFSMDRFFTKMPCDKPIQRGSWGLEIGQPLFKLPGDSAYEENRKRQSSPLAIEDIHFRVDWQTLRRLPLSGGVLFNFKALFTPVTDFREEAYIPSLILKVMQDSKRNLIEYKNTWHVEHVVKPAFERYEKEQIERGLIEKYWVPKTLDESPFFPNWQAKWHAQQGF